MAKKKSVKSQGQKRTASTRKAGAGARKTAASRGGRSASLTAGRRKTAGAKTPAGKARRKQPANPPRKGKVAKAARTSAPARKRASGRKAAAKKRTVRQATSRKATATRRGGTGRERELAQTPETGRTVKGRTNPMPTKRSTGTPAGAGTARHAPDLDRERRQLREEEESSQGPPSSLDLDRTPSAARSGRRHLLESLEDHHESGPAMTGGDVDADWRDAYAVGDEAPGGDNPTPDQDIVENIGRALGVEYQDNEELKGADKIAERDKHRWELDPASSDDYLDRE